MQLLLPVICFTNTYNLSYLFNLLLFFTLILDLSWVQQSSSPATYYQSASSLTFRKEEDKKAGEQDSGRGRGETAISAFHVKQQWITEAGLAFLRNTVSVIRPVITVLIISTPHCSSGSSWCSNCRSSRSKTTFVSGCMFFYFWISFYQILRVSSVFLFFGFFWGGDR